MLLLLYIHQKKIHFYGIASKSGKPSLQYLNEFSTEHKDTIKHAILANNNSFVATCAEGQDTVIYLHSPKGELLTSINPKQITNYSISISPDSKFICAATMLSDVRIWSLGKNSDGIGKVDVAMSLTGHSKGVTAVSFCSSTEVLTFSKDGHWRLWDIGVRYEVREDPKVRQKIKTSFEFAENILLSSNRLVILTHQDSISIYSADSGDLIKTIDHAHKANTLSISVSTDGKTLASAGGDNVIRFWDLTKLQ